MNENNHQLFQASNYFILNNLKFKKMKIIKLLFLITSFYLLNFSVFGQTYCSASSLDATNEYISKVQFGTISNTSINSTYSNYTNLSTDIVRGGSKSFTITLSSQYNADKVLIWIDWNHDGDFNDTYESVYTSSLGVGPFTGNITAPSSALLGPTRMRIRLFDTNYNSGVSNSCGASDYGEVEDYTVNVSSIVPSVANACAASSINAFGYDFISKVEIGTILNNSTYSNYSDYTNNTIVTNMTRGVASPFTINLGGYPVSPGNSFNQILIWIDWNQDGDFNDSGESVYTSPLGVGPFSGSITPPNSALLGGARMRIRLHDTSDGPNSTPCGTSNYGEVEDYVINLQGPSLTVSSNALTIGAPANSTASFGITSNVSWSISNPQPAWLSLSSSTGSNNGTITLTATANPGTTTRTATLVVSGIGVTSQTITVTQGASSALLTVSTNSLTIGAPANSTNTFNIVSNTAWTTSSNQTWLTLSSGSGSNNALMTLTASANPGTTTRTATVTVSSNGLPSQIITVTQDASSAFLTVSTTALTIGAPANSTNTFNIVSNTAWTASSNQTWLTLSSASGSNNALMTLTATANPGTTSRIATVTVSANGLPSQIITVTQDASSAILTVSTNALTIGAPANSTNTFNIVSNTAWTTSSNQTWLTLSNNLGSNNALITLTATANPGTTPRTATVTISANGVASQIIIVTQLGSSTNEIIELNQNSFSVFPNPATSIINIQFNNETLINHSIEVINSLGELQNIDYVSQNDRIILSIGDLSNGVYFINVINNIDNSINRMKFLKN